MRKQFSHLTYESRMLIKQMLESGNSKKDIAIKSGVSLATVYRELKRSNDSKKYDPEIVQQSYEKMMKHKGQKSKLELNQELAKYISKLILEEFLSPAEIIKRLKDEGYQNIPSRNTIYTAIDKRLIPHVTRETLLLKRKKTHMFSNGLIKIPKWICEEFDLRDGEDLDIDIDNGRIIINKSKKNI